MDSFTASVDTKNVFTVESSILSARWLVQAARASASPAFEIRTAFVGDGAPVEVTFYGEDYGKIDTKKDVVYANVFKGMVDMPAKLKNGESVWFEVRLKKHGLLEQSDRIPARGRIDMRRMQWDRQEAGRGMDVKITAEMEGADDGTEADVIVYEYDDDGRHEPVARFSAPVRGQRIEIAWNFQYQYETREIPTENELREYGKHYALPRYFFVVVVDGQRFGENRESGLLNFRDTVETCLKDRMGSAVAGKKFTVTFADGSEKSGSLDSGGLARIEKAVPGPYSIAFEGVKKLIRITGNPDSGK
jgi:hypothetical protein